MTTTGTLVSRCIAAPVTLTCDCGHHPSGEPAVVVEYTVDQSGQIGRLVLTRNMANALTYSLLRVCGLVGSS